MEIKPTPIVTQWGDSIQCKLDYLINMIMWQNEIICYLKDKIDDFQPGGIDCCEYITPKDCPIEFIPPCCDCPTEEAVETYTNAQQKKK